MSDWSAIIGLSVIAILLLAPAVMVCWLIIRIVSSVRANRRMEARKRTASVAGLGQFETYDGEAWFGNVNELQVSIVSAGQPPDESHARRIRSTLDELPRLLETAKVYLAIHEKEIVTSFPGGIEAFEATGVDLATDTSLTLSLCHPADDDGMYRVEFRDGEPVDCGRDD